MPHFEGVHHEQSGHGRRFVLDRIGMESLDESQHGPQGSTESDKQDSPVQTNFDAQPDQPETEVRVYAYLLAFSETEEEPSEKGRPGDLRRRAGGGFWIFDGDAWIEW